MSQTNVRLGIPLKLGGKKGWRREWLQESKRIRQGMRSKDVQGTKNKRNREEEEEKTNF